MNIKKVWVRITNAQRWWPGWLQRMKQFGVCCYLVHSYRQDRHHKQQHFSKPSYWCSIHLWGKRGLASLLGTPSNLTLHLLDWAFHMRHILELPISLEMPSFPLTTSEKVVSITPFSKVKQHWRQQRNSNIYQKTITFKNFKHQRMQLKSQLSS